MCVQPKTFIGLTDPDLRRHVREGIDFLYVDNSYFYRGARSTNFRLIRKALHLTTILPEQPGRVVNIPKIEPWRDMGRHRKRVIIIPPSPYHEAIYDAHGWVGETLDRLAAVTKRPVVVKYNKRESLREWLEDAHAVVTYASVAGVEAAMWGVPVFAGPICPCLPISSGPVENIEEPKYPDREPWLRSLAYANWSTAGLDQINLKDYQYRCVS
jgi:hypothetical protein